MTREEALKKHLNEIQIQELKNLNMYDLILRAMEEQALTPYANGVKDTIKHYSQILTIPDDIKET